MYKCKIKIL